MTSGKELFKETNPESTFVQCVVQLNEIFEGKNVNMDENSKYNKIRQLLKSYFEYESLEDVYEGFLRLLIEVANLHDCSQRNIAVLVVELFDQFFSQADQYDRDFIYDSMPQDKSVYLSALKIAAEFKAKHLEMVASAFRLATDETRQKVVIPLIKEMLKDNEVTRAVEWIVFFNVKDLFQSFFQQIVCHLLLLNQYSLLEKYVGEEFYRRRKLISYLNKLIGMNMKLFRGYTELEELVLQEGKKLIDVAVKYLKLYNFSDSEAPNVLEMRARSSLLAHHYNWVNGQISLENYETTALQSMKKSAYIHRYFLDFLCKKGLHKKALMFAIELGENLETFPKKLKEYCVVNPQAAEWAEEDVKRKQEAKQKQQEEDEQKQCQLDDATPIIWVNTWERLMDTMDNLDSEKVLGIDTEGMPHFHSVKEQVALIQIASSTAVYLIDVIALKKVLDEKQWLTFFEIILFSDDIVTIGYDFNNDLRFLISTFPCLGECVPRISNVFCLYRLLSEVLLVPEACEVVFGSKTFAINLNLNEVTKLFLDIELDKSERIGNWAQRPLRLEQKKYAALDAFALIGCFRVISDRLKKLNNSSILDSLTNAALMTPASNNRKPDDPNVTTKPETYEEFLSHILDVSLEVQASKPGGTKLRTVIDTKFALDSMLFGLGKWMRICGFETKHISDRMRLIKFCEENPEFFAVSAGKAFKEIRRCLPSHQALCVPINTQDGRSNSRQIAHLMRQLGIVIDAANMYSRCVRCNNKSFCRLPKLVAKALFYTKVLILGIDWLGISRDQVDVVINELFDHAISEDEFPYNGEIPEGQYAVSSNEDPIICKCKGCEVDITQDFNVLLRNTDFLRVFSRNQLLDFGDEGAIELSMPVNSKDPFDEEFQFRACLSCGKVQYN